MTYGSNIFLTLYYASPNYFKIMLNSYIDYNYEIIYQDGTWSKIKRILSADSDDNNNELVNITGNIILNGGADSSLKITNNSSLLQLLGGYDNGATLHMFGSEYTNEIAGSWVFYAIKDLNNNDYSSLALRPDGTLTLDVKGTSMNLGLSGIINDSTTGQNGYILFGNKVCFQWLVVLTGEFNNGVNYKGFTLPISIQWSLGGYYNDFGGNQFTVGVGVSSTNANLCRGTGDTESHAGNIFVVSKI